MTEKKTVHLIAAARPNFMKVAPLYHALAASDWCEPKFVHTGQHYDFGMSDAFLRDLELPEPHIHLGVGSGSHAEQTGSVMIAYEKVCQAATPDAIVVVGDVNSTAACAMVGAKLWIPTVHLEAGLRSGDRRMPEEINRLVTDAIVDLLWTPSADANENLAAEGVPPEKIDLVGNIMIDSFELLRGKIEASRARLELGLDGRDYAVVTLHRPSNVDAKETLSVLVKALKEASRSLALAFVAHPRTTKSLARHGLAEAMANAGDIRLLEPMPYIDFMNIVTGAKLAITDSGGLQEETTYLDIPCLTLRDTTERPVTVTMGTNQLVTAETLPDKVAAILANGSRQGQCPPFWDGRTADRAANSLRRFLA